MHPPRGFDSLIDKTSRADYNSRSVFLVQPALEVFQGELVGIH